MTMRHKPDCCSEAIFKPFSKVWVLTRRDRLSFVFINSLFSLWVIRFWHYSWRASMMQVSDSLQIKQRLWHALSPSSLLLLSETGLPPFPIVLCSACPLPLPSFLSWHTVHCMRSWPGRPQVVVMTMFSQNCPLKADATHIRFLTVVH